MKIHVTTLLHGMEHLTTVRVDGATELVLRTKYWRTVDVRNKMLDKLCERAGVTEVTSDAVAAPFHLRQAGDVGWTPRRGES